MTSKLDNGKRSRRLAQKARRRANRAARESAIPPRQPVKRPQQADRREVHDHEHHNNFLGAIACPGRLGWYTFHINRLGGEARIFRTPPCNVHPEGEVLVLATVWVPRDSEGCERYAESAHGVLYHRECMAYQVIDRLQGLIASGRIDQVKHWQSPGWVDPPYLVKALTGGAP